MNKAKAEPKPYSLDTMFNGYFIKMDREKAMEDFWASYEVSVSNHNLGSEKVKIVYQNIVY